ncbi:hypothetical protein I601_0210 [Nocardioides dokdonensis FR1436]|uniref:Secreted protein n=1 Tax=Nocardioides dokdonensis FR1436 TaxID=1300347 RepID=A0A1A9GEJ7_9ACTN|nr:hypothetical protein [Nocardioides dokdonensis]ANH36664.1 hypothetical protein I601_0210 [Nocardioides dokdonensis FR1436]
MRSAPGSVRAAAAAILTTVLLVLVPSTAAVAADGTARSESPDGKAFATADLTFSKYSAVWKPVRVNDRDCHDNRGAFVTFKVRYQGKTHGKSLGSRGYKKPCGGDQMQTQKSTYGDMKIGAAGVKVCSVSFAKDTKPICAPTVWVDNPTVVG